MDQRHTPRRELLHAGGLTLLTVPLAACGGGAGSAPASTTAPDGSIRVPTADVPLGTTRYDRDQKVILSQPTEGTFIVFDSTCPHQGCAVSTVEDGNLVCPCHGSTFDAATGDLVAGPATQGLTVKPSTVEGDEIVISG